MSSKAKDYIAFLNRPRHLSNTLLDTHLITLILFSFVFPSEVDFRNVRGSVVIKALYYNSECRGLDTR
jgi:hypothetical protein